MNTGQGLGTYAIGARSTVSSSSLISTPETGTTAKRRRQPATHYYWITPARWLATIGLPYPYLCGRWSKTPKVTTTDPIVRNVGGLMAISKPRDCKTCVRAYEAAAARGKVRPD